MLAAEKVAGHLLHPQSYPLPPANKKSVETALYDVVMALPKRKRDDFTEEFKKSLNSGADQRKQKYGDLAGVNLGSRQPVADQVKNIPVSNDMKFSEAETRAIQEQFLADKRKKAGTNPVPRAAVATRLDFIVDSLTATEITDNRKDEISLGAFAIDASGTETNKDPFFISKFKKGETVSLGAKGNLFNFSLDAGSTGGTFPATFVAGLFIIEKDWIHNKDLAKKLTVLFTSIGLVVMIVGCVLLALPGVGTLLGIIVFVIGGILFILGKDIFRFSAVDDIGVPVTDSLVFDAPPGPGETISRTIKLTTVPFDGFISGDYTANIRWVTR